MAQNKNTDSGTVCATYVFIPVWTGAVGGNIDCLLI